MRMAQADAFSRHRPPLATDPNRTKPSETVL
jgi:hypothetical protein